MRFFVSLDVSRGLAATWVMLFHFNYMLSQYVPDPSFGLLSSSNMPVLFFFALSGFLMMSLQQKNFGKADMGLEFIFRRLGRIFPMYWLALIFMSVLVVFSKSLSIPNFSEILKQVFLLTPDVGADGQGRILGVAWTLELEMLFYLSFSLLLFFKWQILRHLWFIAAISIAVFYTPNILLFLAGMLAAVIVSSNKEMTVKSLWPTVLCIGFALWVEGQDLLPIQTKASIALACLGIIVNLTLWERTKPQLSSQCPHWLQLNGHCSYSCYLFHIPIGTIILKLFHVSGAINLFNGTVMLLVLSLLTWYLTIMIGRYIESPMNAWVKQYCDRHWNKQSNLTSESTN